MQEMTQYIDLLMQDSMDFHVTQKVNRAPVTLSGGAGNDMLFARPGSDYIIFGNGGNDGCYGDNGNDILYGGNGNDMLFGHDGNDTLVGGPGNDLLCGESGDDTYVFGRGSGADNLIYTDNGGTDVISVESGTTANQLWFRARDNSLEVSIIGTADSITISGWNDSRLHPQHCVQEFRTSDGHVLLDTQVDALVSAMAAFAPPAAGQTTLPPDYQAALNPVIAANWR